MTYEEFKKRLSTIKNATSVQGKLYTQIHVSGDSIFYQRVSGSIESVRLRELFHVFQSQAFINTSILRDLITGRKFSPFHVILIELGFYDGGGRRNTNSAPPSVSLHSINEEVPVISDTDELPGRGTKAEETFFAALSNLLGQEFVLAKSLGRPISSNQVSLNSDYREMHFPEDIEKKIKSVLAQLGSDFNISTAKLVTHNDGMIVKNSNLGTRIIEFDEEQHFTPARLITLEALNKDELGQMIHFYELICMNSGYFYSQVLPKHRIKQAQSDSVPAWDTFKQYLSENENPNNGYIKPKPGFPYSGGRIAQRAYYDLLRDLAHHSNHNQGKLLPIIRVPKFILETINEKSFQAQSIKEIQSAINKYLSLLGFDSLL